MNDPRDPDRNERNNQVAPGASGPGEPGYQGDVQIGEESADVEQPEPNPRI